MKLPDLVYVSTVVAGTLSRLQKRVLLCDCIGALFVALLFARLRRFRGDKSAAKAETIDTVGALIAAQTGIGP